MIGFDGSPELAARLAAELRRLVAVFPEHLEKPRPPTWFEPEELARNEQFDAIVRAHKRDRLALPLQALLWTGVPHHNFEHMPVRRLAWFVPTLLATWLERRVGAHDAPFGPADIERICASTAALDHDWLGWTEDEHAALGEFFAVALAAALATPLPPSSPTPVRPAEDGVDVWSRHAPSVPLAVLRVARAFQLAPEPLRALWLDGGDGRAFEHLLEALFDPTFTAKHDLGDELVADRLAEAFFTASGDRAIRISKAEKNVRRWIARRDDL